MPAICRNGTSMGTADEVSTTALPLDDSHNALIYIVVVLSVYSIGIVIAMVKYLKREKVEQEEEKIFSDYVKFRLYSKPSRGDKMKIWKRLTTVSNQPSNTDGLLLSSNVGTAIRKAGFGMFDVTAACGGMYEHRGSIVNPHDIVPLPTRNQRTLLRNRISEVCEEDIIDNADGDDEDLDDLFGPQTEKDDDIYHECQCEVVDSTETLVNIPNGNTSPQKIDALIQSDVYLTHGSSTHQTVV